MFDNSAEVVPGSGPPANDGGDINQKFEAKRNLKSNLMNFATFNQNFCWNPMFLRVLGMTTCSNTPTQSSSSTRSCRLSSRPVAVAALAPPSSCGTIFFTLCFVFFPNVFWVHFLITVSERYFHYGVWWILNNLHTIGMSLSRWFWRLWWPSFWKPSCRKFLTQTLINFHQYFWFKSEHELL